MGSAESILGVDGNEANSEMEVLKKDLKQVRGDLQKITNSAMKTGGDKAQEIGSNAMEFAKNSAKKAQEFAKDRPVTTALIAVGVVALIGGLIWKCQK